MHQEAIELRFRQRIGALLLDRVFGGQHHEEIRHLVGLAGDGDLALFHRFKQRGLDLGRRAVDLVGKHKVGEDRTLLELELTALVGLDIDFSAGHI